MNRQPVIVKIGGAPARDHSSLEALAREIRDLKAPVAVVHGGGAEVTSLGKQLGITPAFRDGIRMTGPEEMNLVDMVLCGQVNTRLVRAFNSFGVPAVGLTGADASLLTGDRIPDANGELSHTATVREARVSILHGLWDMDILPVIASPGAAADGTAVNINADDAAFAIGAAARAEAVVFLSDVDGVLDTNGEVLSPLDLSTADKLIENGTIAGGMVAKIRSAAGALSAGVGHIVIGRYENPGDLGRLLSGTMGSLISGPEDDTWQD